jgi:hypothetical protein
MLGRVGSGVNLIANKQLAQAIVTPNQPSQATNP